MRLVRLLGILLLVLFPLFALAQGTTGGGTPTGFQLPRSTVPPGATPVPQRFGDIRSLLNGIGQVLALIGGIGAFFALIWGGFQYITAGANDTTQAKLTITYAIVGAIVVTISFAFVRFITGRIR